MLAACRHGSCAARGSDKCITSSVLEQTQAAAAALRSRLLAPSISTPAAAAAQETPGRGMLSANMTTSNTRYLSGPRTPQPAAASIRNVYPASGASMGQHGQGKGTSLGARIER